MTKLGDIRLSRFLSPPVLNLPKETVAVEWSCLSTEVIILLLVSFVKWSPVLPVVFVDCPDTQDRHKDHYITNESKK